MSDNQYLRNDTLTHEQLVAMWQQATEYVKSFYDNEFDLDLYMPVVRDGIEQKLNTIQLFTVGALPITYNPSISISHLMYPIVLATQMAFWIGYEEGKKAEEPIELPKGVFDALGES